MTDSLPPEDPRDALIREQAARLEAQAGQIAAQDEQIAGHGERIAALEALVISRVVYCTAAIDAATNHLGTTIGTSTSGRCLPPAALIPSLTGATLRA